MGQALDLAPAVIHTGNPRPTLFQVSSKKRCCLMVGARNRVLVPLLAGCVILGKYYGHWYPAPSSKLEMRTGLG